MIFNVTIPSKVEKYLSTNFGPPPYKFQRFNYNIASANHPPANPISKGDSVVVGFELKYSSLSKIPNLADQVSKVMTLIFNQAMFSWVRAQISMGNTIKDAILNFSEYYGITEEEMGLDYAYELCQKTGKITRKIRYQLFSHETLVNEYDSMDDLADHLKVTKSALYVYLNKNALFRSQFFLKTAS